jgi:hypothetical protein
MHLSGYNKNNYRYKYWNYFSKRNEILNLFRYIRITISRYDTSRHN